MDLHQLAVVSVLDKLTYIVSFEVSGGWWSGEVVVVKPKISNFLSSKS
jgi:hypothetical protein